MVKAVCQDLGLKQVKSYTTRPPRQSEIDDGYSDHHFLNPGDVKMYKNSMAAYTKIGDYEYFTTYEDLAQSDCYIIDPEGCKTLIEKCGDQFNFVTIYIRRPKADMLKSYHKRSQKKDVDFCTRYDAEDPEFTAYEKANTSDYYILNTGDLQEAIDKLKNIITKELTKKSLEEGVDTDEQCRYLHN